MKALIEIAIAWATPLDGALAVATLALAAGLFWMGRRVTQLRRALREQEDRTQRLSADLMALLECSRGVAQRLQRQERQLTELARRQDQIDTPQGTDLPATRTLHLLQQGYSVADIVAIRDLPPGEAELLTSLASFKDVA